MPSNSRRAAEEGARRDTARDDACGWIRGSRRCQVEASASLRALGGQGGDRGGEQQRQYGERRNTAGDESPGSVGLTSFDAGGLASRNGESCAALAAEANDAVAGDHRVLELE